MKPDKIFDFKQRWNELERETRALEYKRCRWAFDVREEFPFNKAGDEAFAKWLHDHVGLNSTQAEEMAHRALAIRIVPDERDFKKLGDWRQIRSVGEMVHTKTERIAVFEAAKASGQSLHAVLKARGHWPKPTDDRSPTPVAIEPIDHDSDAKVLASFIALHRGKIAIPPKINELIRRYLVGSVTVRKRAS